MHQTVRKSWTATALAIAGLIVGYTLFLTEHGDIATAATECPWHQDCKDGDCSDHG